MTSNCSTELLSHLGLFLPATSGCSHLSLEQAHAQHSLVADSSVLGKNRDATLALEVIGVHDTLALDLCVQARRGRGQRVT